MAENFNLSPAPANPVIGLILVDTATTRFAGNLAQTRQRWLDAATLLASCYSETSYGQMNLTADWLGLTSLPEAWDHYTVQLQGATFPIELGDAVVTALGAGFDFQRYWALVFIIEPVVDAAGAVTRVWADALHPAGHPVGTPFGVPLGNTTVRYRNVNISRDQGEPAWMNSIPAHLVLFHELGHTFGQYDLYSPSVMPKPGKFRNMVCWDPMHQEDQDPGFCLVNRLRFGWIPSGSVPTFDLRVVPHLPATFTLTPLELGPAAAGSLGVELRLADGWDYYLEYRARQVGQLLDQQGWDWTTTPIDAPQRVLLTDAVVNSWPIPLSLDRPDILIAGLDDSDRLGLMRVGSEYSEGALPLDLEVVSMDATTAVIRMQGGHSAGPDPSVRPWNPPQSWQSPDIEITNDRTRADPARYANLPWAGHDNTIVAYCSNSGTLDAVGVVVDFFVCDYGANGPLVQIGTGTGDVPMGAARVPISTAGWVPPASAANDGHWCVVVRIRSFKTAAGIRELSTLNNEARSNYTQFISATKSPASRVGTTFAVRNPYATETVAFLSTRQDNPAFVTYVEHRWVRLAPSELRHVKIGFEYLPPPGADNREPCHVSIAATIIDPAVGNTKTLGGATVRVLTGRATRFDDVACKPGSVEGRVVAIDNGKPVTGGNVIVSSAMPSESRRGRSVPAHIAASTVLRSVGQAAVRHDGSFTVPVKVEGDLRLDYLGIPGFDDCGAWVPRA